MLARPVVIHHPSSPWLVCDLYASRASPARAKTHLLSCHCAATGGAVLVPVPIPARGRACVRACVELSCGFACPPPPRALRRIVPCLPRFDSIPPSHSPPCRPSSREVAQWEVEQFQADFGATRMQVRGPTGGETPHCSARGQGLEPWKALRRQCPVGTWRLYLARWTLGAGALGRAVPGTSSWTAGAHRAGSPRSLQPMERSSGGPLPPKLSVVPVLSVIKSLFQRRGTRARGLDIVHLAHIGDMPVPPRSHPMLGPLREKEGKRERKKKNFGAEHHAL